MYGLNNTLIHHGLVEALHIFVIIGSGNGMVPDGYMQYMYTMEQKCNPITHIQSQSHMHLICQQTKCAQTTGINMDGLFS